MLRILVIICVLSVKCGASPRIRFDQFENLAVQLAKKELNRTDGEQMKGLDQVLDYFSPLMGKIDEYEGLFKEKSLYLPTNATIYYHEVMKDFPELEEILQKNFDKINELFQYFRESLHHLDDRHYTNESFQRVTDVQRRLRVFIDDKNSGLQNILSTVDWIVQYENSGNLFAPLAEKMRVKDDKFCGRDLSPHQILWATYEYIAIIDIKGFVLVNLCYNLHSYYTDTSYSEAIKTEAAKFLKKRQELDEAVMKELANTPRYLRACNPAPDKRNRDYVELEGLYGPYLINEMHMNISYKPGVVYLDGFYQILRLTTPIYISALMEYFTRHAPCRHTCPKINTIANRVTETKTEHKGRFHHWQNLNRCHGDIYDCEFFDLPIRICEIPLQNGRRYEYISKRTSIFESRQETYITYGPESDCRGGYVRYMHSFLSHLIDRCDYCLCKCHSSDDDAPNVIKWISLNDYVSNFRANRVITGVKFVRNDNKIDLQIKEGFLMEHGKVVHAEWIKKFSNNIGYLEIGEMNSKSLILADYEAPSGQVVTGVRFKHYFGEYFGLQIHCTVFNYTTGVLDYDRSYWMDTIDASQLRDELLYDEPDNPTSTSNMRINSKPNQYVKFQLSDLKKTAQAYVIPFFDIQNVEINDGFPLSGIGLVHKGDEGYGGFVAFQIKTYEFTKHISIYRESPKTVPHCISCAKKDKTLSHDSGRHSFLHF